LGSGREGLKVKEFKEERCASVDTSAAGGGTGWSAAPRGEDFTASVVCGGVWETEEGLELGFVAIYIGWSGSMLNGLLGYKITIG
jgi:hypothetical protein